MMIIKSTMTILNLFITALFAYLALHKDASLNSYDRRVFGGLAFLILVNCFFIWK